MAVKIDGMVIDKGADFDGYIELNGINNLPLNVENFHFSCQAVSMWDREYRFDIQIDLLRDGTNEIADLDQFLDLDQDESVCSCLKPTSIVHLHVPYVITEQLDVGEYMFDLEMTYKGYDQPVNHRFKVCRGIIKVVGEATKSW